MIQVNFVKSHLDLDNSRLTKAELREFNSDAVDLFLPQ